MCILYLFNSKQSLSLKEIADEMGFDEETAKKNLQSLSTPNLRIVVFKDGKFQVNLEFKSPRKRIMFPIPLLDAVVKQKKIT
jgi:predicted DNA-binding transcriptional regulator YafY